MARPRIRVPIRAFAAVRVRLLASSHALHMVTGKFERESGRLKFVVSQPGETRLESPGS